MWLHQAVEEGEGAGADRGLVWAEVVAVVVAVRLPKVVAAAVRAAVLRLEGDKGVAGVRAGKQAAKWEVKVGHAVVREARPREKRYNKQKDVVVVRLPKAVAVVVAAVAVKVEAVRAVVVIFPRCRNGFSLAFQI